MGRRALTAEEKANKANRERERLRQYRSAPRQNDRTTSRVNALHPLLHSTNTHASSTPLVESLPEIPSEETAIPSIYLQLLTLPLYADTD